MNRFIDVEELSKTVGVKLPQQIAQTGYFDINGLPVGKANTMLTGYTGLVRPVVVLILIEDGDDWKYFDNELISLPKMAELNRANIAYYMAQKLPDCKFTVIGYLPIEELMAKAPKLENLTPLQLKADLPLQDDMVGLCWIQVQSSNDPQPHLYVANLLVSVCHKDKTYSVNGIVYKGDKEVRMSDVKEQQAHGVPMLYLPILQEHLA